jgi:hypothetical protein
MMEENAEGDRFIYSKSTRLMPEFGRFAAATDTLHLEWSTKNCFD